MKYTFECSSKKDLIMLRNMLDSMLSCYRHNENDLYMLNKPLIEHLNKEGIYELGQLASKTDNEILKIPNVGRRALLQIRQAILNKESELNDGP